MKNKVKQIYARGPIKPVWGYFYSLVVNERDPEMIFDSLDDPGKVSHATLEDEEEGVVFDPIGGVPIYYDYCCKENEGGTARIKFNYFTGDDEIGAIAWISSDDQFVCDRELALRLLMSDLIGIRIEKATLVRPEFTAKEWFHITNDRPAAFTPFRAVPGPYKCWNCGTEPICKKCGYAPKVCPNCEHEYKVKDEEWEKTGRDRLVSNYDEGHPYFVVEPNLWDGADFFGDTITHRMYQFLLSLHAHPFRIIPVAANVVDASDDDLERLEQACRPAT